MAKVLKRKSQWDVLNARIGDFVEAAIAESWKGAGDPEEIPLIELELKVALERLNYHITSMKRGK